jgi:hypothetical protein
MATWEDGPEYAPIERPTDFQSPDAPPLDTAPPHTQMAAWAPKNRPAFDSPEGSVAPLSTLTPAREEPRDPQEPFEVVASTMTSDSAWGAVHWTPPTGQPTALPGTPGWTPAPSDRDPQPAQPLAVHSQASTAPGNFPIPGTPNWFGPGPYGQQPQATGPVTVRSVLDAATPGLCTCLIIGGLVSVISPIILCISAGLVGRVRVATAQIRQVYRLGLGLLAVIGVIGLLVVDTGFSDWWGFVGSWGLLICWALLVTTLIMVYRRLKADAPSPPPYQPPWR